ncbi:hypothetical protein [Moorena producens]|uniref:hypothetical protein n=1 Tax=Moorena producens TaxID=1155739 RepID=UPI003C75E2BA
MIVITAVIKFFLYCCKISYKQDFFPIPDSQFPVPCGCISFLLFDSVVRYGVGYFNGGEEA